MFTSSAAVKHWLAPDGSVLDCAEKIAQLESLIREVEVAATDALDDALLMGCSALQFHQALRDAVENIQPTVKER